MRKILLTFAVMGMVGCVGTFEPGPGDSDPDPDPVPDPDDTDPPPGGDPPGTTTNAKPLFDENVYPVIAAKCISCHNSAGPSGNVTGFVNANPAEGYNTVIGYTAVVGNFTAATAAILTKVSAGHQGVVYTADESAGITAWLDKEVELRNGDLPPPEEGDESPSEATLRVLREWSGCMNIDNFNLANMAEAWGDMNTENNQQCENCHVSGAEGFIASQQADPFFNVIATNRYYMLQYFTVDLTQGTALARMMINTSSFFNVSRGEDPPRQHPRFDAEDNQGMQALQQFYDLTMARKQAGTCDPARLLD